MKKSVLKLLLIAFVILFSFSCSLPFSDLLNKATDTPSGGDESNVVFSDSFKNNKNQWAEGENDGDYADAFYMFQDGVYHWRVYSYQLANVTSWPDFSIDGDFTMSVQAKQLTDSPDDADYGLILRSPDNYAFLSFTVSNQDYSVYVFDENSEWVEIVPWDSSDVVRPGEYNELTVQRVGYDYTFSVNGEELATFTYSDFTEGQPGLNVDIFPEGTTIEFEFDDFLVTAP